MKKLTLKTITIFATLLLFSCAIDIPQQGSCQGGGDMSTYKTKVKSLVLNRGTVMKEGDYYYFSNEKVDDQITFIIEVETVFEEKVVYLRKSNFSFFSAAYAMPGPQFTSTQKISSLVITSSEDINIDQEIIKAGENINDLFICSSLHSTSLNTVNELIANQNKHIEIFGGIGSGIIIKQKEGIDMNSNTINIQLSLDGTETFELSTSK
ncbi:hypothetical protein EI427_02565 [Flammeovirga pectinis]|uniref:Auto-transporter adhesin head GIN domain-containing protein n=1 Tax=Flammeovirga pectinis TaxID=2494373 RepID=A0A3Q9FML7_9BACT|nr:hypothetical protein [Flammeovirga pectinis]AZQ61139.1 hypothetical protein EI427_02565 [Flammeovirga pectinis]